MRERAKSPAERLVDRRVVVPETEWDDDPYLATVTAARCAGGLWVLDLVHDDGRKCRGVSAGAVEVIE